MSVCLHYVYKGFQVNLENYTSRRLNRSALVLVAAQIDFEQVGVEVAHSQARAVQKIMGKEWTNLKATSLAKTTITSEGFKAEPNRQAYRIAKKDDTWAINVRADAITLETNSYQMWPEFEENFKSIVQATESVLDPAQIVRIGVRFVDQFSLPEGFLTWDGLISKSLLGVTADERLGDGVVITDYRTLLEYVDGAKCLLRHGNLLDNSGVSKFLLDFDVFNDNHESFDPGHILSELNKLHIYAGQTFRTSITEDLYKWLEGDQ